MKNQWIQNSNDQLIVGMNKRNEKHRHLQGKKYIILYLLEKESWRIPLLILIIQLIESINITRVRKELNW